MKNLQGEKQVLSPKSGMVLALGIPLEVVPFGTKLFRQFSRSHRKPAPRPCPWSATDEGISCCPCSHASELYRVGAIVVFLATSFGATVRYTGSSFFFSPIVRTD